jgi:hypothetical protein
VLLLHPEVASRSCRDCQTYLYDDKPARGEWGGRLTRGGQPVKRLSLRLQPTPCRFCPKVPAGAEARPDNAVELSERSLRALLHYRECKAVGRFPEDAIVYRNAGIIAAVEDLARDERTRAAQAEGLASMLGALSRTAPRR